MLSSFFKVAYRNILRKKGFSYINIAGLAIGLGSFLFIVLYVVDELSYDRYNNNHQQIYRLGLDAKLGNQDFLGASVPGPLAPALVETYPEFLKFTRYENDGNKLVTYISEEGQYQQRFMEEYFYYADSSFFEIFTIPILTRSSGKLLNRPNTVVLTESTARKYFGNNDPLGSLIRLNNLVDYEIVAICQDVPKTSHLKFDFLGSYLTIDTMNRRDWGSNSMHAYLMIDPAAEMNILSRHIEELTILRFGPIIEDAMGVSMEEFLEGGSRYRYFIEPIADIHLRSITEDGGEDQSDIVYIYILALIALFILLMACINFSNLSSARAISRSKEVGMRKVAGSQKQQLVYQFLAESILLTLIAMAIAVILVELLLPQFNNITSKEIEIDYLTMWFIVPLVTLLAVIVGIIAGIYPAIMMSSFRIINVLKGEPKAGKGSIHFRNGLVVFQFSISIFLIITTFVIFGQFRFIQDIDLGFDKEHILVIDQVGTLNEKYGIFMDELNQHPGVLASSATVTLPGKSFNANGTMVEGAPANEIHIISRLPADNYFLETFKIELKEGRYFDINLASDSMSLVINESAIQSLGLEEPIIGTHLIEPYTIDDNPVLRRIIGVIEDINFESIYTDIRPMAIEYIGRRVPNYISVRFDPSQLENIVQFTEELWSRFILDQPFQYYFLNDDLEDQYFAEKRLRTVFGLFSFLAIFIASLGLLGLASFAAERRTKEIGIRKSMGSTIPQVISLLTRNFTKWVLLANIFAWPAAWLFATDWLNNFAFRIGINPLYFFLAGFISLFIAWGTILYHSGKVALKNPADALRHQ